MNKRVSITIHPRTSIYGRSNPKSLDAKTKNSIRKSQTNIIPMNIFVSNGNYYNYALERISYPNSNHYILPGSIPIQDNSAFRVRKRDSIIKEPLVLSYQKVNMISYKIVHTAYIEGESLNSDHICKIDHESMRCTICGCHMGWMFVIDGMTYPQPIRIDYFDYETIFFEESLNNEIDSFISFKNNRNLHVLRKYFSYIVERNPGVGFQELYEKFKLINLYPTNVFKELGISYREMVEKSNDFFKIQADFEGANIQAYDYKIEENICKIRLLMRGDSNVLELEACFWFYFKIVVKNNLKIEFEILNYKEKPKLFDQDGFVYIYDERFIDPNENYYPGKSRWRSHKDNVWFDKNDYRTTRYRSVSMDENIQNNDIILEEPAIKNKFYSLKFNYQFEKASKNTPEEVLFAAYAPYTYNDLLTFLGKQEKRLFSKAMQEQDFDLKTKKILLRNDLIHYERSIVSHTRCGTPIFLIKITSSITADEIDKNDYFPISSKKKKKNIVIFARQHPFEIASSWIIEGIITSLLNDNKKMNIFRTFFNFYIIPMINIDGVMLGNTISGLSGVNFNRIWKDPIKEIHPEIYHIKEYFVKMQNEILLFFDFHSTYQKSGMFLFSNAPKMDVNNSLLTEENLEKYLNELGFILLLPKLFKSHTRFFNEKECRYRIKNKEKENTARNVFHNELNIKYCYTLQSSLYNYIDNKDNHLKDFKLEDYKNFGKDFLSGIFDFVMILAENWIENDKKNNDKNNNIEISSSLKRSKKEKAKKDEKLSKKEEREKYFFHHLEKVKTEFETKTSWKSYFSEKELRFLKHKSKKKLIPREALQPFEKSKKNLKKKAVSPSPEESNLDLLQYLISLNENKEENEDALSNSIDLFGNLSFESEKEKETIQILEIKTKQKNILHFYKESIKNDNNSLEKSPSLQQKNGSSFVKSSISQVKNNNSLNKSLHPQLKNDNSLEKTFPNPDPESNYPIQDQINNSFDVLTSKELQTNEKNLNNSSILIGNTTSYTLSQPLKKEYIEDNLSLDKSNSFNNKSTFRIDPINKHKFYKNKSSLNLGILPKIEDSQNEISSAQQVFLVNLNEKIPQPNISESLLFSKCEFLNKIREKLRDKNAFSADKIKNVKIPIRKNIIMDQKMKEDLREHQIESTNRYKWKLKRPCSLGVIPVNPFIKHKKELQHLYSFHLNALSNSNSKEIKGKKINKNNNYSDHEKNEYELQNEKIKTAENFSKKTETKTVSLSPWSEKKTES